MREKNYYNMTEEELFKELKTDFRGLSSDEALIRREKYGLNELPKKKKDSIIKIFFKSMFDPIILLLIVAIISSVIVGEIVDAYIIR